MHFEPIAVDHFGKQTAIDEQYVSNLEGKLSTDKLEIKRFEQLLPNNTDWPERRESEVKAKWQELDVPQSPGKYEMGLLEIVSGLACDEEGAPFVLRGLIKNGKIAALGEYASQLTLRLNNTVSAGFQETCPGAARLTEADKSRLSRAIWEAVQVPKQ